jgi:hypothetical protein
VGLRKSLETTGKKLLTLRHRRLVPGALLVHRNDSRVVFKPRLAHLAAVHLGFSALCVDGSGGVCGEGGGRG